MLNKIIYYSLHNRLVVLICSLLLMIAGTYTAFNTDVDVFPDLNAPTVVIMTEANGMAPEEVERLVTFPVETAVNGAMDVRRVRSSSTTGFSVVWVEFDWGTDIYRARQIVSEKLAVVSESLPENVGKPTLGPQSSILGEMMIIGLTVDDSKSGSRIAPTTQMDLRTIADWTIRPRLLSTGGVAQVAVIGGDIKEYQILLDPTRMKHYGVSLGEVLAVTRNMNRNANRKGSCQDCRRFPRFIGKYRNSEDWQQESEAWNCFRTGETCRVDYGHETAEHQYDRLDGKVRRDYGGLAEEPAC